MPLSRNRRNAKKSKKKKRQPVPSQHTSRQPHPATVSAGGQVTHQRKVQFYQGIIPSPEMMEQYAAVDPTLPSRILQLTEDEGNHRRDMEKKIVRQSYFTIILGYIFGAVIVLPILFLAAYVVKLGNPEQAKDMVLYTIVPISVIYVLRKAFNWNFGKKQQDSD